MLCVEKGQLITHIYIFCLFLRWRHAGDEVGNIWHCEVTSNLFTLLFFFLSIQTTVGRVHAFHLCSRCNFAFRLTRFNVEYWLIVWRIVSNKSIYAMMNNVLTVRRNDDVGLMQHEWVLLRVLIKTCCDIMDQNSSVERESFKRHPGIGSTLQNRSIVDLKTIDVADVSIEPARSVLDDVYSCCIRSIKSSGDRHRRHTIASSDSIIRQDSMLFPSS